MINEKGYHKLLICGKIRLLIKAIYQVTDSFPRSESNGLTSQIRRAIVSVLLNVVEGQRRASQKDFLRFLDTADASLAEVEVCLEIAQDLQFISETNYVLLEEQRKEIAIMLTALIRTVKKSI